MGGGGCVLDGVVTDCAIVKALRTGGAALTPEEWRALFGMKAPSGDITCETGVIEGVITADARNLGISLYGYTAGHVTIAGLTNGGADRMTEVYFNIGSDTHAWDILVSQMAAAGFVQAGYDPLHGDYTQSYRQMTADGTWSMQVSYNASHNLQIDIDPHNPMQNFLGHAFDVLVNTLTGLDTNYHTAASRLGVAAAPCK